MFFNLCNQDTLSKKRSRYLVKSNEVILYTKHLFEAIQETN